MIDYSTCRVGMETFLTPLLCCIHAVPGRRIIDSFIGCVVKLERMTIILPLFFCILLSGPPPHNQMID